jgi:GTPase SAR1 family protein
VGKTSLLHRFTDNVFPTGWMASIGVDFRIKTIDVLGLRIKLQGTHNFGQRQPHTALR